MEKAYQPSYSHFRGQYLLSIYFLLLYSWNTEQITYLPCLLLPLWLRPWEYPKLKLQPEPDPSIRRLEPQLLVHLRWWICAAAAAATDDNDDDRQHNNDDNAEDLDADAGKGLQLDTLPIESGRSRFSFSWVNTSGSPKCVFMFGFSNLKGRSTVRL